MRSAVRSGDGNVVHLGQIMVVSCQPENGDSVDSGGGCFFCEFDCSERFVNGEHRAAEKSNLLSGDDRGCTLAQAIKIGQRLRGGIPGFILALEDCGDALAAGRIVGNLLGFFFQPFPEKR
jgi:hypothetical protein